MKDPFAFHGISRRHYFEGWYFNNVAPDGTAYSFIPGVSYDSRGSGHLSGRGYLEKDWGTSMPSAWVWIHGNGFPDPNDSVMISIVRLDVDGARVGISVRSGPVTIEVNGTRTHAGMLAAPVGGAMDRRIAESLDSKLDLIVTDGGRTVTETAGGSAGIELVGDVDSLRS